MKKLNNKMNIKEITSIILPFFYLYILLCYVIVIGIENKLNKGIIECMEKGFYRKCIYKNIYFIKNRWIILNDNINISNCVNIYAQNLNECWKPKTYPTSYKKHLIYNNITVIDGLSVPFKLTYIKNYGHALWDDLYSIFATLVKFGYKDHPFKIVVPKDNRKSNPNFLNDIYTTLEKFSKRNILFLDKFNYHPLLFKYLIVGSSHQCQRCVTTDYSLKYSREYNITKLIRDRMYEVFSIKPNFIYPLEGVIIHNKRYTNEEINILTNVIKYFNKRNIKLTYIDFRNYSTFYKQLLLLSRIHIYISGPGTGLLNFPFIADPGVVIHLGHIHFGCPQYLEQYILEGSPHIKAYYYPPIQRMKNLSSIYIKELINKSISYIMKHNIIYVKKKENLNEIGKLYVKICKIYRKACEKLIDNYDWGYGFCRGVWAENLIYFPSVYIKNPEIVKIVKSYNETLNLGCSIGDNYSPQIQCKI